MKVAVLGATGLVGNKMLTILEERNFPVSELIPVASFKSAGKTVRFKENDYKVVTPEDALLMRPDLALFSAGGNVSLEWAPRFAEQGCTVIDNSSAWRMDSAKKLVVPEVNASVLNENDKIIANPNCSTIQLVVALNPLHVKYSIKRIVVSTYQSVTGTGLKAVHQLISERNGEACEPAYPHPIDLNVLPHIDIFLENGYTKEEMKMLNGTRKIMGDSTISLTATTVRVPVIGGHSEAVNVEFRNEFDVLDIRNLLENAPGVIVEDEVSKNSYPMPINANNKDEVFVGRIRRDESQEKTLNLWIVADNLRKGAATNAIQIAEYLLKKGWLIA
jgi:aspartate-semialdehyde dehydrogenase